jgi:hypothetical protein
MIRLEIILFKTPKDYNNINIFFYERILIRKCKSYCLFYNIKYIFY